MKNHTAAILVVDDEAAVRESLCSWFQKDGYTADTAADAVEALKKLSKRAWDIILLDIKMPNISGMELLRRIRQIDPDIVSIMITAYASVDTAVEALKGGAFDYVVKPIDPDDLSRIVRKAIEQRKLKKENLSLRTKIEDMVPEEELIGDSPQIKKIQEIIETVSQTDVSVLIRGDSGTGKELIARLIHAKSTRRYSPLVAVNCGALPESLLESELFGHEKGSFTGAQYKHRGKLEISNGGTLFLDEVGTIDAKTQVDLLRVLDSKQFTRLGGNQVISVDFRVICATNQDLEQLVKEGKFREDFYYRINVFPINLPPLRDRSGDIRLFAQHFLERYAIQIRKKVLRLSPEALSLIMKHDWPGNVRELKNAIERAVVVAGGPEIRPEDLPFDMNKISKPRGESSIAEVERAHILDMLGRTGWNITRTAQILGIDRVTLYNKIKKYGLSK
ncbi:MAG: sigma-54 dependent transcriptional regulator [Candidatus Krumholzibacteria bacterium]|nr:sigma-54 dependent transcriptional regulator [Candidatus Krumholzibacteria bacterium]